MTDILMRRNTDTEIHRTDSHVKIEAGTGVMMYLQARGTKNQWQHQKLRDRNGTDSPQSLHREHGPAKS